MVDPDPEANNSRQTSGTGNERWATDGTALKQVDDGLTTLAFETLDRRPVPEGPVVERPAISEIVKVRLKTKPPD